MEKYSSGLVAESFWFTEVKAIIKLLNQGKSWDDIRTMCLEENLLGISKEYRAKRIYGYLKNRIQTLDEGLMEIFLTSDLSTQKLINIIAVSKQNKLFFEFLYEVYREKIQMGIKEFEDSDVTIFFKNKQNQNEEIAHWTDVTLKRLKSTYINFMTDAGLISIEGKEKKVTAPIMDITLERYLLSQSDSKYVNAITGVN